jgi:hypothetical protein
MNRPICLTPFLTMPPEQAQRLMRQLLQSDQPKDDLTSSTESTSPEEITSTPLGNQSTTPLAVT